MGQKKIRTTREIIAPPPLPKSCIRAWLALKNTLFGFLINVPVSWKNIEILFTFKIVLPVGEV